ncbi:hypothetical protein ACE1CI_10105 [Aerosakkonemataceae cyanobacterium BLCC-F50]|uniref:Uncharacterized protein n=1 Tax=Floridaenema flaviceps BLCC-F50 TaxID=3153642 RepID=A0ABV4XQL9_9CYAN
MLAIANSYDMRSPAKNAIVLFCVGGKECDWVVFGYAIALCSVIYAIALINIIN